VEPAVRLAGLGRVGVSSQPTERGYESNAAFKKPAKEGVNLRIKRIGLGLLVVAGSLSLASAAFAGTSTMRLNGAYSLQDQSTGTDNEACLIASFTVFQLFGEATGVTGACTVDIFYDAFAANKASASVLKDDGSGKAAVSQSVETFIDVEISGLECPTAPYSGEVQPEKCKASGSVNASEPSDTVDKGKAKLTCDVGSDLGNLVPSPTVDQLTTIVDAFSDRSDVKISNGKVTINLKGEPGVFCD
jgi:hypothetical protein